MTSDQLPTSTHYESLKKSPNEPRNNVLIMSIGFFGLFMAFNAAQSLQSSLNGTLGNVCLAVLYATFTFACIVAPRVVSYLGPKLSMIIGAIPYVIMILSNLKPSYYISVPANFLVGLGAPLLWTGEGVYLQRCAVRYDQAMGGTAQTETKRKGATYLNGIFFSCFQLNGVFGLLLASIILQVMGENAKTSLFLILTVVGGAGAAGLLLVRSVSAHDQIDTVQDTSSQVSLVQTLRLLGEPRMSLLVPLLLYNGMSLGFVFGDYTRYIITETLGTTWDGYVMATFYGTNALATYLLGRAAATRFGRRGCFTLAALVHAAFYAWFLVWRPQTHYVQDGDDWVQQTTPQGYDYGMVFLGAVVFAIGDAVFESQLPAVLQSYFSYSDVASNAAMSNLKMWQSLGFTAQFVLGFVLASLFWVKLVILVAVLVVGVMGVTIAHKGIEPIDEVGEGEEDGSSSSADDAVDVVDASGEVDAQRALLG